MSDESLASALVSDRTAPTMDDSTTEVVVATGCRAVDWSARPLVATAEFGAASVAARNNPGGAARGLCTSRRTAGSPNAARTRRSSSSSTQGLRAALDRARRRDVNFMGRPLRELEV